MRHAVDPSVVISAEDDETAENMEKVSTSSSHFTVQASFARLCSSRSSCSTSICYSVSDIIDRPVSFVGGSKESCNTSAKLDVVTSASNKVCATHCAATVRWNGLKESTWNQNTVDVGLRLDINMLRATVPFYRELLPYCKV